jgi:hypothetical protein
MACCHSSLPTIVIPVLQPKENPVPPHGHSDPDAIGGRILGRCGGLYPDAIGMTLLNNLVASFCRMFRKLV